MYEFADRLINLALPRVRDFRGVNPNAFDGRGNYALGIKEQLIFPEVEYDKVDKVRGMDVIFVTTAKTDEEARELLTLFNMPFAKYYRREKFMAKTAMKVKTAAQTEILYKRVQPLPYLWTSTCIFKKIRYLPYLLRELAYKGQIPGVKKASW